jgi:hypothetical protein
MCSRVNLGAMTRGEGPRAAWMQTFSLLHVVWRKTGEKGACKGPVAASAVRSDRGMSGCSLAAAVPDARMLVWLSVRVS